MTEPGTLTEGIERILPDYVRHDYGCDTQHGGSRCECDVAWQIERLHKLARQVFEAGAAQERARHASCVCCIEDGLVQEWVSKARAVAKSKGYTVAARTPPPPEAQE